MLDMDLDWEDEACVHHDNDFLHLQAWMDGRRAGSRSAPQDQLVCILSELRKPAGSTCCTCSNPTLTLACFDLLRCASDWDDEACVRILSALRQRVGAATAASGARQRVVLALVEMALVDATDAPLQVGTAQ